MRRKSNDPKDPVTLFVGNCKLIVINNHKQIDYAIRTVQLTQNVLYTYKTGFGEISRSRSQSKAIELDKLTNHECEYLITSNMRPKLLLDKRDPDIVAYLRELKAPEIRVKENEEINIVALSIEEEFGKYINGFIFSNERQAIDFYEGINCALAFQLYYEVISNSLPFNSQISNRLGETLNGRCLIDPMDFIESKSETDEVNFFAEMLKAIKNESLFNFRDNLFQLKLFFKIIDEKSLDYAFKFMIPLQARVQKLTLSQCELTSNMFSQIMLSTPHKIIQKLVSLQILDFSDNYLNDDIFTTISNLLKYSKNLNGVNLSKNKITLQKQGILYSFLQNITRYKLNLNLSDNCITNAQIVAKYFVNVEGNVPITVLDLIGNQFKAEHLGLLVKCYIEKRKNDQNYQVDIRLGELEFEDPSAFQFLTKEYRQQRPTALSVPMTISRHPYRKAGKQVGMTELEVHKSEVVQQKLKKYWAEALIGNFLKRKQLKQQLLSMGIQEEVISSQPPEMKEQRLQIQRLILTKIQNCVNFNIAAEKVVSSLNEALKWTRLKGLTGNGVNFLTQIKIRIEDKLSKWEKDNNLGLPFRQSFYQGKHRYRSSYDNIKRLPSFIDTLVPFIQCSQKELLEVLKHEENEADPNLYIFIHFLLLDEQPKQWKHFFLQYCLEDPRIVNCKVLRLSIKNQIKFEDIQRINKAKTRLRKPLVQIAANYGIERYNFSRTFIESGLSSSGYTGILSNLKFSHEDQQTISSLIVVFNNFMQIIYQKPNELTDKTILYANTIAEYMIDRQKETSNDLKIILAQELFLRIISFYDSTKHQQLKRGILLTICQFLLRRVAVEEEMVFRVIAHLIKTDSYQQDEMNIHFSQSKVFCQGKIDWKIKDPSAVRQILTKRGKFTISIADISNQSLQFPLQIDELASVSDLWQEVKANIDKISELISINKEQLECFWLCGTKNSGESWDFRYLLSYQHIGKIVFQDLFERKFYLRRVAYPSQYHSLSALMEMKYQDLLSLFVQGRQSFRQSAFITMNQDSEPLKIKMVVDSIWIDTLIEEEIMLSSLRKQDDKESVNRYRDQRQKIINRCMTKIYLKYLPVNFVLTEEMRNSLVTSLRIKKEEPIPKIISQNISACILDFVRKLGISLYTTSICDSKNSYIFYANNHNFCFLDRTSNPAKTIKVHFKHLLWLQLIKKEKSLLRFDAITVQKDGLERHQFSIGGEESWLAQCYSLILSICNLRLHYPSNLIFTNEDTQNGVTETKIKEFQVQPLKQSPLEIGRYVDFVLMRNQRWVKEEKNSKKELPPMQVLEVRDINKKIEKQPEPMVEEPRILQKPEKIQVAKEEQQKRQLKQGEKSEKNQATKEEQKKKQSKQEEKPVKDEPIKEKQKQIEKFPPPSLTPKEEKELQPEKGESKIILPIPAIPERNSYSEYSVRRPSGASDKTLQIEQILQSVGKDQKDQKDDTQVIPVKKRTSKNQSRRKSRNR